MLVRGRDFLDTCAFLSRATNEAASRTRVSRAYYAAYLEARSFCGEYLGFVRSLKGREHQEVPRLLATVDPEVMVRLTFLRKSRNTADYDLDVSAETMARVTSDAERMAEAVIAALDAHAERLARERERDSAKSDESQPPEDQQ